MADRPLRPATDHRLGRPLPHQLTNRPQPPPPAAPKDLCFPTPLDREDHTELPRVSAGYPLPVGRLATCSSPVRHVSPPKRTPFDLHALGTPPALILSQDQTLHQCRTRTVRAPGLPPSSVGWPSCGLCLLLCCVVTRPATPPPSRPGLPPTGSAATPPPNATIRFFHDVRRPRHTLLRLPHTTGLPPPRQGRPQALRSLVKVPLETLVDSRPVSQSCPASLQGGNRLPRFRGCSIVLCETSRYMRPPDFLLACAIWIRSNRQEQSVPCSQCLVKNPYESDVRTWRSVFRLLAPARSLEASGMIQTGWPLFKGKSHRM